MNANESWLATGATRTDAEHLAAHWMPFSGNREFKANPRMVTGASGHYYTMADGKRLFVSNAKGLGAGPNAGPNHAPGDPTGVGATARPPMGVSPPLRGPGVPPRLIVMTVRGPSSTC